MDQKLQQVAEELETLLQLDRLYQQASQLNILHITREAKEDLMDSAKAAFLEVRGTFCRKWSKE